MTLKIAVLAPTPSESVRIAMTLKIGWLRRVRKAYRRSCMRPWTVAGGPRLHSLHLAADHQPAEYAHELTVRDWLGPDLDTPLADGLANRAGVGRRVHERERASDLPDVVHVGVADEGQPAGGGPARGARVEVDGPRPEVTPLDRVEQLRVPIKR